MDPTTRSERTRRMLEACGALITDDHFVYASGEHGPGWIAKDISAIDRVVDDTLANSSIEAKDIDRVFMTGGTSFIPAVRSAFEAKFGADRLAAGGELTSVASGLALRAAEWG